MHVWIENFLHWIQKNNVEMEINISVTKYFIIAFAVHCHNRYVNGVIGSRIKMHWNFVAIATEDDSNCLQSVAMK